MAFPTPAIDGVGFFAIGKMDYIKSGEFFQCVRKKNTAAKGAGNKGIAGISVKWIEQAIARDIKTRTAGTIIL